MKISKSKALSMILALCLALVSSDAGADEANYSAAHYLAGGVLLLDVGASIANGAALAAGKSNRLNGYFGVVTGVVSFGFVALDYALTDDKELRDSFALVCGTAGTVSIVLGAMNVRRAPPARKRTSRMSEVRLFPYLTTEGDHKYVMGGAVQMTF